MRPALNLTPPRDLLAVFGAKSRADGIHGVVVVSFTPSDPAWPTLAAASCTSVEANLKGNGTHE